MANESIRIRTTPGSSQNIRVKLEQDFDFLEVLSLKITQEDLYQSFCSNYGVVVGRVIANKGFGVPNAKVSIFIPITDEDSKNVLIKDLYPYKTPYQKNAQGVRYNLLLSKQTCLLNTPVGTFPSKEDVVDNDTVLEVFEKYYKYTTKTNNSGDFMIFGVPTGQQQIHMDVDLSDIGILSLRPYDMIREGSSPKLFESSTQFKTSLNLDSLPQINTIDRGIEVIPFWGDPENCEIGITRIDMNLGSKITSTALFFGSVFTDGGASSLNKACNPAQDMGEQKGLKASSGTINMIRVSEIDLNAWNNNQIVPIALENFDVDGGQLIDDNGTFAYQVPMNIANVVTDEFGVLVPSPDPEIGIPTKGMYRFKMKLDDASVNPKFRTATMLFPSLGVDFGGTQGMVDTGEVSSGNGTQDQRFTTDINQYDKTVYPNSRIELDFHTFEWKQLYTIAHFIKQFKKGGNRFSFLGIKNTDEDTNKNPFPYNDAIWKSDLLFSILSLLVDTIVSFISILVILVSICFIFCFRIKIGPFKLFDGITIAGVTINPIYFPKENVPIVNTYVCQAICPFGWITNLIPPITLPADGFGPDGNGYVLDLSTCDDFAQNYCSSKDFMATYGSDYDCDSDKPFCFYGCAPGSDGNPKKYLFFGVAGIPTNFNQLIGAEASTNTCLQVLYDWRCGLKYNVAEFRNVIRRNFNDAWVFGTAYMFSFKYSKKVDRNTGNIKKEKFCGPGADNWSGDNYKNQNCCPDTEQQFCTRCLLRGPGFSNPTYLASTWSQALAVGVGYLAFFNPVGFITGPLYVLGFATWYTYISLDSLNEAEKYHVLYHNAATTDWTQPAISGNGTLIDELTSSVGLVPQIQQAPTQLAGANTPKNGAVDVNDIIYCNALMSTKIVSLGRIEMCEDILKSIEVSISGSQAIKEYNQSSEFYTGTFFESGWDTGYWVQNLKETSYENPREVLLYLSKDKSIKCKLDDLFHNDQLTGRCHEWSLKDEPYFYMKENSKIYNTITTSIDPLTGEEIFNPLGNASLLTGINQPIADQPSVDNQAPDAGGNLPSAYGGFTVDLASANRFSPCGGGTIASQSCNPGTNWNGTTGLSWPNMGPNVPGEYQDISNNPNAFDQIITRETRNNQNTRSNIPYYYFGVNPGKTAINRLRKDFFLEK